ncbi:MAG: hypothetical protein KDE00_05390 [Rhodobacteraceae bacterium]|nr:hypothetical protein [Nitratireductor sp.]MCB2115736.1 hypothetical protein [Paracoccaceae bacterium]
MATTRKSQPGRRARRQKQPATIDLTANPPEEEVEKAEAEAGEEMATVTEPSENEAVAEISDNSAAEPSDSPDADEIPDEAPVEVLAGPPGSEKRGGIGGLIQAAIAAVVGGGIALGGANLMGQLGAPGMPEGSNPAALSQYQEEIQSLKAQLENLQQSVAGGASVATDALSARIEALEAGSASGGENLAGALEAAKAAADSALQRSEAVEARLVELNAAIQEGGEDGSNGAAVLGAIEERLAALETGAPAGEDIEASIGENREAIAGLKAEVEAVSAQINEKILPSMAQVEAAAEAAVSGQKIARSVSARALSNVLEQGGAFSAELASAEALAGGAPEFGKLRAIAAKGIETPAQLLAGFDDIANRILKVESRPEEDAGVVERFIASARSLVVVRPAGPVEGNSTGAILSRVEAALKSGNSAEALPQWETLPEDARQMGAEWEQALRDRIEAESLIGAVIEKLSAGQG